MYDVIMDLFYVYHSNDSIHLLFTVTMDNHLSHINSVNRTWKDRLLNIYCTGYNVHALHFLAMLHNIYVQCTVLW